MFCVIYEFKVKPGLTEQFREAWSELTQAIYRQNGSLGSRLHQAGGGVWIAYAQWPNRKRWEQCATEGVDLAKEKMLACLEEKIELLYTLDVTDDLLEAAPFGTRM